MSEPLLSEAWRPERCGAGQRDDRGRAQNSRRLSRLRQFKHRFAAPAASLCGAPSTPIEPPPNRTGTARRRPREHALSGSREFRRREIPKLKLKWAFSLGDVPIARGQPVVIGNRIFVGTSTGKLFSLDAKSGCIHWTFDADSAIRSGVVWKRLSGANSPGIFRRHKRQRLRRRRYLRKTGMEDSS